MTPDELRKRLYDLETALRERGGEIWRAVIAPDGAVVKKIFRGYFRKPVNPDECEDPHE